MRYQPRAPSPGRPLLNIDAGELPGEPDALLALADVLNVACGGHAGDAASMDHTVAAARGRIAAHPSYPDREGFGRRRLEMGPEAVGASVEAQCRALRERAESLGRRVEAVKPHGALYHAADGDPALAAAVVDGAVRALGPVVVIGPAGGALAAVAAARGLELWREGFADRGVGADGRLLPRGTPGALVDDPEVAAAQARRLAGSGEYETLCVHGDTPGALAIARAVAGVLAELSGDLSGELSGDPPGEAGPVLLPRGRLADGAWAAVRRDPEVEDLVLTDTEAGLWLAPGAVVEEVLGRATGATGEATAREVVVPVRYDGPDLVVVAAELGLSPEALVARHAGASWSVLFLGFLPGFAYLDAPAAGPGAWGLSVPRLGTPRVRVPPGSVAVAGERSGVYPFASPGGWRILGTAVGFVPFDAERGAVWAPGDRVRFVRVG